jgi:hypothetical protein
MKKTVKIPIYFGDLIIIIKEPMEEVMKRYNLEGSGKQDCFCCELTSKYPKYLLYISETASIGEIGHECMHLLQYIYTGRGIKFTNDINEHDAYIMGFLIKKVYDFWSSN